MNARPHPAGPAARAGATPSTPDAAEVVAAEVVAAVAGRLADPETVRRIATAPGNLDSYQGLAPRPPWEPQSLIEGFPGVALLHAELGRTDPGARVRAHAHLAAAGAQPWSSQRPTGLYGGPAALAFAARAAAHGPSDYATLLTGLDQVVLTRTQALLAGTHALLDRTRALPGGTQALPGDGAEGPGPAATGVQPVTPVPPVPPVPSEAVPHEVAPYEVLGGLSGLGRYLLACLPDHRAALEGTLRCLVRLSEPVRVHGADLPGWWAAAGPADRPAGHRQAGFRGHVGLGMAHGVAGPLALLALAGLHGVRVPGTQQAAERMAEWLLAWREEDGTGTFWPSTVTLNEQLTGRLDHRPRPRAGWCHGSAGIARALHLAGRAFGRPAWSQAALEAHTAALLRALGAQPMDNSGLCHGWAGLLRTTQLLIRDTATPARHGRPDIQSDSRPDSYLDVLADAVVRRFRPETPFGYALRAPGEAHLAADRAGFLEGAAGTALALHAYIRRSDDARHTVGTRPATGWDAALLID
ncbi:lanthionine synthetase C family protein [Kitasatospora sp. NBC_00085]|uniref:lanthionine synthetase C family protein n=1 Tax=unclassified Kitasatospora TaxID=2633591 RepID=UPI00324BD7C2